METTERGSPEKIAPGAASHPAAPASPILRALIFLHQRVDADVRVHVAKRKFERDPMAYALELFEDHRLARTEKRNGILVYLNLKSRKFAVVADEGVHRLLGQRYWDELAANLREDLQSTYFENAIALTLYALATDLKRKYPLS